MNINLDPAMQGSLNTILAFKAQQVDIIQWGALIVTIFGVIWLLGELINAFVFQPAKNLFRKLKSR